MTVKDWKTSDFDYELPPELIAQEPVEPRDSSRLMVVSRGKGVVSHRRFSEIGEFLRSGDVLVVNDTKVFRARLFGERERAPRVQVEVFLVRPLSDGWLVLVRPGKKLQVGDTVLFSEGLHGEVLEKYEDGTVRLGFGIDAGAVIAAANRIGAVPIPPYIKQIPERADRYQTVYARETGSVAAPTAGFHFTPELLASLQARGIEVVSVTLHVGLGTFLPVKSDTLGAHKMHSEYVEVGAEAVASISRAKAEGRRVIAVGTTATRALEGVAAMHEGALVPYAGDVNIFITPGFPFRVIDGLITNFHLPKSTLLVLVSAFAGREVILRAYEEAVRERYRFYSFGDAMLLL